MKTVLYVFELLQDFKHLHLNHFKVVQALVLRRLCDSRLLGCNLFFQVALRHGGLVFKGIHRGCLHHLDNVLRNAFLLLRGPNLSQLFVDDLCVLYLGVHLNEVSLDPRLISFFVKRQCVFSLLHFQFFLDLHYLSYVVFMPGLGHLLHFFAIRCELLQNVKQIVLR